MMAPKYPIPAVLSSRKTSYYYYYYNNNNNNNNNNRRRSEEEEDEKGKVKAAEATAAGWHQLGQTSIHLPFFPVRPSVPSPFLYII
jgi:hypothetical protein